MLQTHTLLPLSLLTIGSVLTQSIGYWVNQFQRYARSSRATSAERRSLVFLHAKDMKHLSICINLSGFVVLPHATVMSLLLTLIRMILRTRPVHFVGINFQTVNIEFMNVGHNQKINEHFSDVTILSNIFWGSIKQMRRL